MGRRLGWCCVALLLAAVGLVFALPARAQTERILDYHSEIDVHDDGAMIVLETIRVQSYGEQIRHGIYRDFPTRYTDRLGNRYDVGFEVLSATRDGAEEEFRVTDLRNGKRVYLGRSSYLVPQGEHTYTITYTTNRQLGFFRDHDELFWNVTGNGWIFPIDEASATVRLPSRIDAEKVRLGGYTGPQASMAQNLQYAMQTDGSFAFRTVLPLGSREGLTILLMWPKGLIAEPTARDKLNYFFGDNRNALVGVGGIAGLLLYYLAVWLAVGRDPKAGSIVALYEPPDGFPPAAMRYLVKMDYDNKAFAASVLDMAVKGYLKIKEEDGTYTLSRDKADERVLSPDEKRVADVIFGDGRTELWLHNENHVEISGAIAALKAWLKTDEQRIYFVTNAGYTVPAIALSAVMIFAVVSSQGGEKVPLAGFMCVWLTMWSLGVAGLVISGAQAWRSALGAGGHRAGLMGKALMLTVMAVPFLGGEAMGLGFLISATSVSIALLLGATVFIHLLFHYLLKTPTRTGRSILDRVMGFKMFLGAVEKDRMNVLMPPQQTPEVFEKYLPYALALDVEQAWAEKFAGVLSAAGQAPGTSSPGYSPIWYSGPGWSSLGAADFASSFGTSLSGAIASSSSAPGSGGGGGGGGSGGGGGGGGGGGW